MGKIDGKEIMFAMSDIKIGKASGLSWVVLEMLKADREPCLNSLTTMISCLRVGWQEWMLRSLVPAVKGKGDSISLNLYRAIEFSEDAFKLYGKVLEGWLWKLYDIDKMQYRFMPGKETVDAVITLGRIDEKVRLKGKKLFFLFVDWVARKVICFVLMWKGVPEYLVNCVMLLYHGCKITVSVEGESSDSFSVKVGVH